MGGLLRRLHQADAAIEVAPYAGGSGELADPTGGPLLCHNGVCPENVVFRNGRATALIDFDLAAPGHPVWDVAMAARYWVSMLDPASATPFHPGELDAPARLRILADSYGLSPREHAELPDIVEQATETYRAFVARRVANGDPVYLHALVERGGWDRWDRIQAWLVAQRDRFTAALLR